MLGLKESKQKAQNGDDFNVQVILMYMVNDDDNEATPKL